MESSPCELASVREPHVAQLVLERIVRLHMTPPDPRVRQVLAAWDYDTELQQTAERTLVLLERARYRTEYSRFGPAVRWARRLVLGLPAIRRQLLSFQPFGSAIIHGDLHPGNVCCGTGRDARRRCCSTGVARDSAHHWRT
jgi:hypothetical protein